MPIPAQWISDSVLPASIEDVFRRAYRDGLFRLEVSQRRGHLPAVIGAVAESVAALLMDSVGFVVFAHLTEPGARGVDLLLLGPEERVLALEVKGTLRPGTLPRLRRSALEQMSAAWLDHWSNRGMAEWGLEAADVYGGVIAVDLAAAEARLAVTADFLEFVPVPGLAELDELLRGLGQRELVRAASERGPRGRPAAGS